LGGSEARWKHFFDWERCALVTDVAWAKHIAKFSEFLAFVARGIRAFPEAEAGKATTIGSQKTRNKCPQNRLAASTGAQSRDVGILGYCAKMRFGWGGCR